MTIRRHLFLRRSRRWPWAVLVLASTAGALWWGLARGADTPPPAASPEAATSTTTADAATPLPHHTATGFQNRYGGNRPKGTWEVMRWQWSRQAPALPNPPLPAATPDFSAPAPNITWIGHSTVLAQLGNLTLITDPHFSERASPVSWAGPRRVYPLPVALSALPHVDVVLISHNHYDHLDVASVRGLQAQAGGPPLFIVPLGLKPWMQDQGLTRVVELDWWQSHVEQGVDITLTPAQHWSSRTPFDRSTSLWGGFAVLAPQFHLFYTGDTGYSRDFRDIREHFAPRQRDGGFDLALIPTGCYEPRAFMRDQHINPAEAVQIHQDVGAKRSVGVHWGTFQDLCDEPLDQGPKDLAVARQAHGLSEAQFQVLRRGETLALPSRTP